mmetsp:Transcript_88582/g.286834  ORF Transcript_88582/g.286834 Transcript_88582/m.286834 type:complete len:575 (-) Transcript_88582:58-1782(-)
MLSRSRCSVLFSEGGEAASVEGESCFAASFEGTRRWIGSCTAASACRGAGAQGLKAAAVTVASPASLRTVAPGYFATFSALPPPPGELAAWVPDDPMGCADYLLPGQLPGGTPGVVVVRRGNCTFLHKARLAKQAGAEGLIVVSDTDYVQIMGAGNETSEGQEVGIMTLGVAKSFGDKIIEWCQEHGGGGWGTAAGFEDPVLLTIKEYEPSLMNISELFIILLGTALVAAGAYFSTSDLSTRGTFQQAVAAPQDEVMEVDCWLAIGFFFFGSCFLVVLYYLMQYMIYFIIFTFCLGGFNTLLQIGSIFLAWLAPQLKQKAATVPLAGSVTTAEIIAALPAALMVAGWLVLRNTSYGWPFQDVIGAGFLCWLQRTMRLPNIKIASLFLCIMFCFDIFWVFISPLLFQGHSVMVTVATGGGTGEAVPMLLRIPSIGDPLGNDRLLGFGDIALPGLLVSYLRRHDMQSHRPLFGGGGYFGPALLGYFCGLCCTIMALVIMKMGQPALLYLVPGTLGTTVVLALRRGELGALWEGRPCPSGGRMANCGQQQEDGHSDSALEQAAAQARSACISGNDGL